MWYGWNTGLEEYGTIIFTYPLAFITIFIFPIVYFFIIGYYILTGNFTEAGTQFTGLITSIGNNIALIFYVPYKIAADFIGVSFGLSMYVLQFFWWILIDFLSQALFSVFWFFLQAFIYFIDYLIAYNDVAQLLVTNWTQYMDVLKADNTLMVLF